MCPCNRWVSTIVHNCEMEGKLHLDLNSLHQSEKSGVQYGCPPKFIDLARRSL